MRKLAGALVTRADIRGAALPAALRIAGALAAGAAGTGWALSDWRVERSADGVVCGVERNFLAFDRGTVLERASTHAEACTKLFGQTAGVCPTIGPSSQQTCSGQVPKDFPLRVRMTPIMPGKAWPTADTGWIAAMKTRWDVLIGGGITGVDRSDFPALVSLQGAQRCLGAIVGPHVVLTAAHCVPSASSFTIDSPCSGAVVSIDCRQAVGNYPAGGCSPLQNGCEQDVQFCVASATLACARHPAESIDTSKPASGPITLIGNNRGQLAIGAGTVVQWPDFGAADVSKRFVKIHGVTLSNGDSGAPAYHPDASTQRRIVAVNAWESQVFLSALWGIETQLQDWVRNKKQVVCGINTASAPTSTCR